ncbi:MAG: sialidase family protein, partial [archaeon]
VVWDEYYSTGNVEILYSRSSDGGFTWSAPFNISSSESESSSYPAIAISPSGDIYVVWSESDASDMSYDTLFSRSPDSGLTWSPPAVVFNSSNYSLTPRAAVGPSGDVHVVWQEGINMMEEQHIYYSKSADNGSTWTEPADASGGLTNEGYPAIAVDSLGNPHIAWVTDYLVKFAALAYANSSDGGFTWNDAATISDNVLPYAPPSLAVMNDTIHISWSASYAGKPSIYYVNSSDLGETCPEDTVAITCNNDFEIDSPSDTSPQIALSQDGTIYVAWTRDTPMIMNGITPLYSVSENWINFTGPEAAYGQGGEQSSITPGGFALDGKGRPYDVLFSSLGGPMTIKFSKKFYAPSVPGFAVAQANGSGLDEKSDSLMINNSEVSVKWLGLNTTNVQKLSGKNLSSAIKISSASDSASISVNESLLNHPANITVTGFTGISNLRVVHDGVVVYENGALTEDNDVNTDLITKPTFENGVLHMEVASFSTWQATNAAGEVIVITSPGFGIAAALLLFAAAAIIIGVRIGRN